MASGEEARWDRVAVTALWTAAERARESRRTDRLFEDPLAESLAGQEGHALADRMRRDGLFDSSAFAVRTRYYDDVVRASLAAQGAVSQVVVIAAGMDVRLFRLPLPRQVTWYELDRPELLARKDRVLDEVGARPRSPRRTVGVDLTDTWAEPLAIAGFDATRPALWLAEGLIFYLDPVEVHRLMDEITRLSAPGSELLTDTIDRTMLVSPQLQSMRDRLAEQGSPWRFGTDEPEDELFLPRGWSAEVSLYSEVGARLRRWPRPAYPRGTAGAPQSFLIRATR